VADDSETDSEFQEDKCQAFSIGFPDGPFVRTLTEATCEAPAIGEVVTLLHDDAPLSNTLELAKEGKLFTVNLCPVHRAMYEASVLKRKCAFDGCHVSGSKANDGISLCPYHRA
jgi:hypothetical protein